jgi:hypothetical protein
MYSFPTPSSPFVTTPISSKANSEVSLSISGVSSDVK